MRPFYGVVVVLLSLCPSISRAQPALATRSLVIRNPANGELVSGEVVVRVEPRVAVPIASVEILLDGSSLGSELATAPFTMTWDTTAVRDGSHALIARAQLHGGGTLESQTLHVTVKNGSGPLDEAVAPAQSYYIDPEHGDDANPGTYASPWKSFKNIRTYYNSSWRPPTWRALAPGDFIYLVGGVLSTVETAGHDAGPTAGRKASGYFRNVRGAEGNPIHLKAYPGTHPVIDPQGGGDGLYLLDCRDWEISGIEIRNARSQGEGGGVVLPDSERIVVFDMDIHDTDGRDNDNMSGLHSAGGR